MKKGTRITYRAKGRNPDGDNRINLADKRMITEDELREAFKDPKMVFMKVTDHEVFGVNKLKFKGKNFLFLEANPVTFYFSLAYDVVHQLDDAKETLERVLEAATPDNGHGKAVAFSYIFKVGSVGVIFSFLALEAFLNQQLPDHTTFEYQGKIVSKEIIERRAIL